MAPEMLLEEEYDKSADVFSFGMVQLHSLFAFRSLTPCLKKLSA
jgi:serine/threonine protein kinase